mmetsp:Transcript_87926/g.253869  ORF Transcript_87926/g.253869 Transcript_87926/m.253869 type:complete len:315 (-) Transcript_87926:104-1048(-)
MVGVRMHLGADCDGRGPEVRENPREAGWQRPRQDDDDVPLVQGAHLPRLPPFLNARLEDVSVQDRRPVRRLRLGMAPGHGAVRPMARRPHRVPLCRRRHARAGRDGLHVAPAPPVLRGLPDPRPPPRLAHGRGALRVLPRRLHARRELGQLGLQDPAAALPRGCRLPGEGTCDDLGGVGVARGARLASPAHPRVAAGAPRLAGRHRQGAMADGLETVQAHRGQALQGLPALVLLGEPRQLAVRVRLAAGPRLDRVHDPSRRAGGAGESLRVLPAGAGLPGADRATAQCRGGLRPAASGPRLGRDAPGRTAAHLG